MRFDTGRRPWRWLALAATLVNLGFNAISGRLAIGEGSIQQIVQRHSALFTPADYAFAIWGLIYLATLVQVIHQLLPSQRNVDAHDFLAKLLTAANVLAMAWIVVFRNDLITLSVLVIALTLAVSCALFIHANEAVARHELGKWVLVPASLWIGWLSVATIANVSLWLVAMGWPDTGHSGWTFATIGLATALGLAIGARFRNWIYPAVIAWAQIAIWVERREDARAVALVALLSGILMIAWAAFCAFQAKRPRRGFRIFHGPLDA
jgi:hypothetical protein